MERGMECDTLIRDVEILDGGGGEPARGDVAVRGGVIERVGESSGWVAREVVDGSGKTLAPGFIDTHTHDDLYLIRCPEMLPKLSQGVTTVVVGNCGISGAPVRLADKLPDPMNLLGEAVQFRYPAFQDYVAAVAEARPAVNVAALVGHTALRSNFMDRLDRTATADEIAAMRGQLCEALEHGALGLSTGLAYASANAATTDEVVALSEPLAAAGAIYATHLRSESDHLAEAVNEALRIGSRAQARVVISHLKCTGIDHWGGSGALLNSLDAVSDEAAGWDCYPYAASSSTLDLKQVDERVKITITWSETHPEVAGQTLAGIASAWNVPQIEAARRLQPAGAIYYGMSEEDVRAILRHPRTMIGSDGLPNDPRPHPRLWGTFPRVLGVYGREQKLFSMSEAVRKMTSLPAQRLGLTGRGWVREGYAADLVLFDAATVRDAATFADSTLTSVGIEAVWVNGVLSYSNGGASGQRSGRFLSRTARG
jgi:N-acyl-D-aspartate/D-glutamate deacylase